MLVSLKIKDFILIDRTDVEFGDGLTVITGETGSGKSVLIAAINLLLGDRANDGMIRTGQEQASIEGEFDVSTHPAIAGLLDEAGIDSEDTLIIKRRLTAGGKSRCFINGSPTTVGLLRRIGENLINIHGQNEHQSLLEPANQLEILDSWAQNGQLLSAYREKYKVFAKNSALIDELSQNLAQSQQRSDYLQFQIDEIKAAGIEDENEEEEIEKLKNRFENACTIQETLSKITTTAQTDAIGALPMLSQIRRDLASLEEFDQFFETQLEVIDDAICQIKESISDIENYQDNMFFDEEQYQQVTDRYETLRKLRKKHGPTLADVLENLEKYETELENTGFPEEKIENLKAQNEQLGKELKELADKINEARQKSGAVLAQKIQDQLADLNIQYAKVEVKLDIPDHISPDPGKAMFMVSLNKGHPVSPLHKTASGGEMSRLMLAIKNVIAGFEHIPTLIFDEIDANIGGRTASAVGRKLREIAKSKQIFCITHLPQVACMGKNHLVVDKNSDQADTTLSKLKVLRPEERENEIARMLSGDANTTSTIAHARELLNH